MVNDDPMSHTGYGSNSVPDITVKILKFVLGSAVLCVSGAFSAANAWQLSVALANTHSTRASRTMSPGQKQYLFVEM